MLFAEGVVKGRREVRPRKVWSREKEVSVVGMCGRREERWAVTAQVAGAAALEDFSHLMVDSM